MLNGNATLFEDAMITTCKMQMMKTPAEEQTDCYDEHTNLIKFSDSVGRCTAGGALLI
jgi:hypothetical protein